MATVRNARDAILQAAAVRINVLPSNFVALNGLTNTITTNAVGTFPNNITIVAVLNGELRGTVTWSGGVGTPNGNTLTVPASQVPAGTSVTVTATLVYLGNTYTTSYTITHIAENVTSSLSRYVSTVNTAFDGTGGVFDTTSSTMTIYIGSIDTSTGWTYSWTVPANVTATDQTTRTITVTGMDVDSATLVCTATRSGFPSQSQSYRINKVRAGQSGVSGTPGTSPPSVLLSHNTKSFTAPTTGFTGISFTGGAVTIQAYVGSTKCTYNTTGANTFDVVSLTPTGVTVTGTAGADIYTVNAPTAMSQDNAFVDVLVRIRGAGGTQVYSAANRINYSLSRQGASGTGTRGSISNAFGTPFGIYFSGTTWPEGTGNTNANLANRVIWLLVNNLTTPITALTDTTHLVNGDTVTLQSSDGVYVKTMTWQSGSWKYPGTVIDGNLLITGTLDGNKIQANTISASKINARGLSILDTAGNVILSAGASINASQLNNISIPTITTATTNFNNRNDRIATAVVAPTVPNLAGTIDHTTNTDGSANIQFNWTWTGTESDIDGFIVYVKPHGTIAPAAQFTTWTEAGISTYYIPASNRSFILNGLPADYFYTFGVRAYREVDADINASQILYSTIAQPLVNATETTNGAYRPSSNVSFGGTLTGNAAGTINGLASSNYLNANISLTGVSGTIALSGAAAGSTVAGVVMPGNPITTGNITTYISSAAIGTAQIANLAVGSGQIADAAITNAKIGNFIASTNYNGSTTNPFTTPGTSGWCITKSADAVFNRVIIRRPLRSAGGTYTGNSTNDGYLYTWTDPKGGGGGWTGTIRAVIDTGLNDDVTITDQEAPHYVGKAIITGVTLYAGSNSLVLNGAAPPITAEVSVGTLSTLKVNAANNGVFTLGLQTGQPASGRVYVILTITPANARELLNVAGASALYLNSANWSIYRVT